MELIRISDSKLKVMLTAEDMAHYAITCEAINYENTETRRVIWEILDEAKKQTGFDAASDRIFIQVYPSRTGGCELYITKLGENNKLPPPSPRASLGMYRFPSMKELLAVCEMLKSADYCGESAAYTEGDVCYLILRQTVSCHGSLREFAFLEEFGERLSGAERLAYIEEYATEIIATDAVSLLSSLN